MERRGVLCSNLTEEILQSHKSRRMAYRIIPDFISFLPPLSLSLSLSLSRKVIEVSFPFLFARGISAATIPPGTPPHGIRAGTCFSFEKRQGELNGGTLTKKIRDTGCFVIEATCKSYVAYQRSKTRSGSRDSSSSLRREIFHFWKYISPLT